MTTNQYPPWLTTPHQQFSLSLSLSFHHRYRQARSRARLFKRVGCRIHCCTADANCGELLSHCINICRSAQQMPNFDPNTRIPAALFHTRSRVQTDLRRPTLAMHHGGKNVRVRDRRTGRKLGEISPLPVSEDSLRGDNRPHVTARKIARIEEVVRATGMRDYLSMVRRLRDDSSTRI